MCAHPWRCPSLAETTDSQKGPDVGIDLARTRAEALDPIIAWSAGTIRTCDRGCPAVDATLAAVGVNKIVNSSPGQAPIPFR